MSKTSMFVPSADDISILETVFFPFKIKEDLDIFILPGRKVSATLSITSTSTCITGNVHQGLSSFHKSIFFPSFIQLRSKVAEVMPCQRQRFQSLLTASGRTQLSFPSPCTYLLPSSALGVPHWEHPISWPCEYCSPTCSAWERDISIWHHFTVHPLYTLWMVYLVLCHWEI